MPRSHRRDQVRREEAREALASRQDQQGGGDLEVIERKREELEDTPLLDQVEASEGLVERLAEAGEEEEEEAQELEEPMGKELSPGGEGQPEEGDPAQNGAAGGGGDGGGGPPPEGLEAGAVGGGGGDSAELAETKASPEGAGGGAGGGGGGRGQGRGGVPIAATRGPSLGGMPNLDHRPAVDARMAAGILASTGLSPEEHAAAVQRGFDELRGRAEALQAEAVQVAGGLAQELQGALSARAAELAGAVQQARDGASTAYSQARTRVQGAGSAGLSAVTAAADGADAQLDASRQTQGEALRAHFQGARAQIDTFRATWLAPFTTATESAATGFADVATQMSGVLSSRKAQLTAGFGAQGDAIARYKGEIQGQVVGAAVDAAALRFQQEAPQKAAEAVAAQDYVQTLDGFLAPLAQGVDTAASEGLGQIEAAWQSGKSSVAQGRLEAAEGIEGHVRSAVEQLDADEASTLSEIDGLAQQLETDAVVRGESGVALYQEAAAGFADAYRGRVEAIRAQVPPEFLSAEQAEAFFRQQAEGLAQWHEGNLGRLRQLRDDTRAQFEEDVAEDLGQIQQLVAANGQEAGLLADEKAGAIQTAGERFGESMRQVGGSVDAAMASFVPPRQEELAAHLTAIEGELQGRLDLVTANLTRLQGEYRAQLQGEIDGFRQNVDTSAAVAGVDAELQGMAREAYSAMRGWGTDENKLFNALRKCTSRLKGQALERMWELQYPSSGSLWSWIADDCTDSEEAIARAYLNGNTAEGARLELDASMRWYGDDEAQIERILRDLSPTDRAALQDLEGWQAVREELNDNLGGTDLNVVDALLVGNDARADAYRLRDQIDAARRRGDHDALHQALAGVDPGRLDAVQQEFAHIQAGVEADAVGVEPLDQAAAEQTLVDFALAERTAYGPHGEQLPLTITGANADLAEQLIRHGNDSVEADVARFEVERTRRGGPKEENMETALYASDDLRHRLRSDDPQVRAQAEAETQARRQQFEERWQTEYGAEGQTVDGAIDALYADSDHASIEQRVHRNMLEAGTNTGEVASDLAFLSIDGWGTDDKRLQRAFTGMRPDEVEDARAAYARDHGDGRADALDADLGVNEHAGWGSEVSGDERREMERLLLGDERYMNDEQRLALVNHELKWSVGDESTGFGRGIMGDTHEDNNLRIHADNLQALLDSVAARMGSAYDDQGRFQGTPEEYEEYRRLCAFVGINAAHYREQQDRVLNYLTTAAAVVVAAAVTFATGGAAGPAAAMWIAGLTGASKIALSTAVMGGRYGWERMVQDASITAVEVASAGLTKYLGPADDALSWANVQREMLVEGGVGFATESGKGLINEQDDWLSQGLRGGLVNSVGAVGSRGAGSWGLGGADDAGLTRRAVGSGVEESIGEIAKGTVGVGYDAAAGTFSGDLDAVAERVFGGVPTAFVTGSLKTLAGDWGQRAGFGRDGQPTPETEQELAEQNRPLSEEELLARGGVTGEQVEGEAQRGFEEHGDALDAAVRAEIDRYREELVLQELVRLEALGQGAFVEQVMGAGDLAAMEAMMMRGGAGQGQGDRQLTDANLDSTETAASLLAHVGVPASQIDGLDPMAIHYLAAYAQAYSRGDVAEAQRLLDRASGGVSPGVLDLVSAQVVRHHYGAGALTETGQAAHARAADLLRGGAEATPQELAAFRAWYGEAKFQEHYDALVLQLGADHPAVRGMTPEELVGVYGYTTNDYRMLNGALRTLEADQLNELLPYLAAATSGLQKLPTFDGQSIRGTNVPPEVAALLQPGATFTDRAFLSTSRQADTAFPGAFRFVISGTSGHPVEFLSAYPHELEVLYPPGTRFRVTSRSEDGGGVTVVHLEEVVD